jgi:uncharacterized membrane protein YraQ (UPF0718 family)
VLDAQLALVVVLLLLLVGLAWATGGQAQVRAGLAEGGHLLLRYGLLIAVSFLAAGVAQSLIPRALVEEALGERSGLRGILLATGAGALTPAGPFVSMPIAAVLLRAGASTAAVVAFLTSWSVLAVHRLVAWETPILGVRFALLRYGVSLVLPVLAGLLTRLVVRG